ncbi:MAG: Three-deoxy-D-manno-octulosonic-acid transferase-like protein [Acidobacteriales bacterium]|nr:Three-deoxy-D-manno-octulosonic-acid transferase-like protein [Terriglobales bacterium]
MYFLYSAGLVLALLLTLPYWLVQATKKGKYRAGLNERLGRVPSRVRPTRPDENCIWVHAVSLGEVIAVSKLITSLQSRFAAQGWRILVTTTTATGQKLAREKFGDSNVFYFPLDFAFAVRPYIRLLRPKLVILAETEFWPNFLRIAHTSSARIAVVNARISDRSYPRYQRLRAPLANILRNVDIFLAQSQQDRHRLSAIGADPARIQVTGNLKFDVVAPDETPLLRQLRAAIAPTSPVLVCGSTVEDEEALLVAAFKNLRQQHPDALLILAPRHPERFSAVAQMLTECGLPFVRRTEWNGAPLQNAVFLLDSIGELASIYSLATAAFVGGSLVPRGGHNILEPAQFGKPIFVGPYTENFRDIISIFQRENAVHVITASDLNSQMLSMFEPQWQAMGQCALEVFRAQSGATQRTQDALEVLMWMPSTIKQRYQQVTR